MTHADYSWTIPPGGEAYIEARTADEARAELRLPPATPVRVVSRDEGLTLFAFWVGKGKKPKSYCGQ